MYVNDKKKTEGCPSSMMYNGKDAEKPQDIAELFADHFSSIFSTANQNSNIYTPSEVVSHLEFGSLVIRESDVVDNLLGAKPRNSIGSDGLSPNVLKNCLNSLAKPLTFLFNKSLATGIFPQKWKASFVTPIFKSASRNNVSNYRGIAILPSIGKSMEKIVYNSLYEFVKNRISTNQHGFFKGRSTSTNLLEFTTSTINSVEQGKQIDVVYFSKAFDLINHRILLKKLEIIGVHSSLLSWIS